MAAGMPPLRSVLIMLLLASHVVWAVLLLSVWRKRHSSEAVQPGKPVKEKCSDEAAQDAAAAVGGAARSQPWPGTMPMECPSRATYNRVQADPGLLQRSPELLTEFEAAPWLLPPRTPALPYTGVHQLDALLRLRAGPAGKYNRTVTLLTFNRRFAVIMQNTIYSLVKFGGVRNYLVGTHTPEDLEACADLNLPCADVAAFLPQPLTNEPNAGAYHTHDYLVLCWLRPAVVAYLLQKGYAVMSSDSDIAYTITPMWPSYLAFLEGPHWQADAAIQGQEVGGSGTVVNCGHYLFLPTPASIHFTRTWADSAAFYILKGAMDQEGMLDMLGSAWRLCTNRHSCRQARAELDASEGEDGSVPLIRAYPPSHRMYWPYGCSFAHFVQDKGLLPLVDVCDWSAMFFHPICTEQFSSKLIALKRQQVWFVDDDGKKCRPHKFARSGVPACLPLRWRLPDAELLLYSCPSYGLGMEHEREAQQQHGGLDPGAGTVEPQVQKQAKKQGKKRQQAATARGRRDAVQRGRRAGNGGAKPSSREPESGLA